MFKYLSVLLIGLICSINFAMAISKPSPELARSLINNGFSQSLMFFKPHDLPLEFERTHQSMINKLDIWVKLGLVLQTETRFLAEKMMYGSIREVSVGGYKYELNLESPWVSDKGIFYGKPLVLDILEISTPSHIGSDYFCEVYLSWYAIDVPNWVSKIDLKERKHRQIKRAYESKQKPFEKRLYLIFRNDKWVVWDEKGEQSLF